MKNLLNRLTRLMIIMLMLVDRTPFLNVNATCNDRCTFENDAFDLHFDTNGSSNLGIGNGGYEEKKKDLSESV